jgi:hypothetical protein
MSNQPIVCPPPLLFGKPAGFYLFIWEVYVKRNTVIIAHTVSLCPVKPMNNFSFPPNLFSIHVRLTHTID